MEWLTPKQVARSLLISPSLVYRLLSEGRIRHMRVGSNGRGAIRVLKSDLDQFVEEQMREQDRLRMCVIPQDEEEIQT